MPVRLELTGRAMPKSVIFASPPAAMMMLPGLMSRWMTPLPCAKSSARRTSAPMRNASSSGSGRVFFSRA